MNQFITKFDVLELSKTDPYYHIHRWNVYESVIKVLKTLQFKTVLEIGPYKLPIVKDCDTLDFDDFGINPTYIRLAENVPWPIENKSYDIVIACSVMEHIGIFNDNAIECKQLVMKEIQRVSKQALFSIPYMWPEGIEKFHENIDESIIDIWTLGIKPEQIIRPEVNSDGLKRIIYVYQF